MSDIDKTKEGCGAALVGAVIVIVLLALVESCNTLQRIESVVNRIENSLEQNR